MLAGVLNDNCLAEAQRLPALTVMGAKGPRSGDQLGVQALMRNKPKALVLFRYQAAGGALARSIYPAAGRVTLAVG